LVSPAPQLFTHDPVEHFLVPLHTVLLHELPQWFGSVPSRTQVPPQLV
jgi:hypothetical protein